MSVSTSEVFEYVNENVNVYNSRVPRPIMVNGKEIGVSACPTEIVRVNNKGRDYFLQIFYDEGSNVTLLNKFCSPAVISSRKSSKPVRINSVNGEDCQVRQIETIVLPGNRSIEGILVPELVLRTSSIQRPNCLSDYDGQWALQLACTPGGQVPAQVLLGTDRSYLFPAAVYNDRGNVVQTENCRLKKSYLTGRYLLVGSASPGDKLIDSQFPSVHHLGAASLAAQEEAYSSATIEEIITI